MKGFAIVGSWEILCYILLEMRVRWSDKNSEDLMDNTAQTAMLSVGQNVYLCMANYRRIVSLLFLLSLFFST